MPSYAENLEEAFGYPIAHPYDILDLIHTRRPTWNSRIKALFDQDKPPPGGICPCCGREAFYWELDHQNPWRPFVATMLASPKTNRKGKKLKEV